MNKKIILFFALIYLTIIPYVTLPDIGYYDSKRIFQIFLFLIIGLFAGKSILDFKDKLYWFEWSQISLNEKLIYFSFTILFISGYISVLKSYEFSYSYLEFTFFLLLLSVIYVIKPESDREQYRLGIYLILSALFYSIVYLIIFFGNYISSFSDPLLPLWPDRLSYSIIIDGVELKGKEVLFFVHKRFFNHTQTWTLPILIGLLLFYLNKNRKEKVAHIFIFILISFWWMLIFASGARGSFIALFSALLVILLFFRKDVFPFIKTAAGTSMVGGIFYYLFFRVIASDGIPIIRTSDSGRFQMWERAIDLWLNEPLFGIGPLQYAKIINSTPYFSHPHNFYIQFLTEWGLIAFVSLVLMLFVFYKMIIGNFKNTHRNPANKIIYIAFVWAITSALIHASLSGVMHTPLSQIWLILICAWLIGHSKTTNKNSLSKYKNSKYGYIIYLILLIVLISIITNDISSLTSSYEEYLNKYSGHSLYSRFWEQGLFE
jgi:putative inorganic carbon (hco3(-)) transporter